MTQNTQTKLTHLTTSTLDKLNRLLTQIKPGSAIAPADFQRLVEIRAALQDMQTYLSTSERTSP